MTSHALRVLSTRMALILSLGTASASATTYTVTNTADSGAGSLRQAITDANTNGGTDTIAFNIPGSGVHTIDVPTALPTITSPVIIDGTTQPGYVGSPVIELNGASAGSGPGLSLAATASASTVRGLAINRFVGNGILIRGNGNIIAANYIGTNPAGTADLGNSGNGIQIGTSCRATAEKASASTARSRPAT
jgi:hypothetical protein